MATIYYFKSETPQHVVDQSATVTQAPRRQTLNRESTFDKIFKSLGKPKAPFATTLPGYQPNAPVTLVIAHGCTKASFDEHMVASRIAFPDFSTAAAPRPLPVYVENPALNYDEQVDDMWRQMSCDVWPEMEVEA